MCGIFGGFAMDNVAQIDAVARRSRERGRDSWGIVNLNEMTKSVKGVGYPPIPARGPFLGYYRGTPVWEDSRTLDDVQPFRAGADLDEWTVVHNGTIANDKELWEELKFTGSAEWSHPAGRPTEVDSWIIAACLVEWGWETTIRKLKGSFAILAYSARQPRMIYWASNYKPLWMLSNGKGAYTFASQRSYFDNTYNPMKDPGPIELGPYQYGSLSDIGVLRSHSLYPVRKREYFRTLVVCSGGLDSSVVAWQHHQVGHQVNLLHFRYGCRAETKEVEAVYNMASAVGGRVIELPTNFFEQHAQSVLTDAQGVISGGEAGAEFANEWVPARNTVMLALALAYAEANDYDCIALGSNQEESGAFPDNEQEFVNKWRELAPYALKAYKHVTFSDPLAGLMKHDIVEFGHKLNMPFELTWSCYHGEEIHCGDCGPCSMRRKAFEMAGVTDPTEYAK